MRIEGVTTSPGLLPARKVYTLASGADGFWMVHVSWAIPGETDWQPSEWSRVDGDDLSAVVADRRSKFVPWRKIRSVHIGTRSARTGESYIVVRLRGVRVRRLEFRTADRDEVETFFEPAAGSIS
jgi:hypothetical protein